MQKNLKIATFLAAIFAIAVFSSKYFYTSVRNIMSYRGYSEYEQINLQKTESDIEDNSPIEETKQEEVIVEDKYISSEMKEFDYNAPITEVDSKSLEHVSNKKVDYSNYADRIRIEEPELLDENGLYEALMQAVADNDLKRVKLLIKNGANLNSPDGGTSHAPIFWAIANGNVDIIKLLISKGAKVNTPDEKGIFPIHWIVEQSAKRQQSYHIKEIFDLLLNAHPNEINRQDTVFKETPLMLAISIDNNKAFAYLLDKGANLTIANRDSKDAVSLALAHSCHTCLRLIKNKEALNKTTPSPNFASTFTAPDEIWSPPNAYKTVQKAKKVEQDPNAIVIQGTDIFIPTYKEMPQILPLDKEEKGPNIILREK